MRQFTKEFSLKMTWATYIHIYFSYLLPPDSFFINKGKTTTTTLRQLPRYISYAQSALFFSRYARRKYFTAMVSAFVLEHYSSPCEAGK